MGRFINTDKRTKLGRKNAEEIAILKFLFAPFKYFYKFIFWIYKYVFIYAWKLFKWLLEVLWVVLKFIFGLIKKLFIKAADQDGDGDVDFKDVKLVLKRFTSEGRTQAKIDKLTKKAEALAAKSKAMDQIIETREQIAEAREQIAKEKK